MADERELTKIESAQELEVGITGPGNANRLFVYTGLATVDGIGVAGDDIVRFRGFINLSKLHNGRKFNPIPTLTAPVAFLANVHGNSEADDFTWAVSETSTQIDNGDLKLIAELAVQGENCSFAQIAYQVNVITKIIRLQDLEISPKEVGGGNLAIAKVVLSENAPTGGLFVDLEGSDPLVAVIPVSVQVPASHNSGTAVIETMPINTARISLQVTATFGPDRISRQLDVLG